MKKVVVFLAVAFALHACGNDAPKSIETNDAKSDKSKEVEVEENKLPQNFQGKKNPKDFIPDGYVSYKNEGGMFSMDWEEIKGDLNKDGLEDVVLVIKGTDKSKIIQHEYRGQLDRNRRGIIVLMKKGDHYEVASKNYDCFSSENEEGGVYFAAELDVLIDRGNLIFSYGHGRYGYWKYTFRYQNGDMELIGYDSYAFRGPVPQYEVSMNFMTKKQRTKDNLFKDNSGEDYTVKFVESWKDIRVDKRHRLSEIEDIDELYFEY